MHTLKQTTADRFDKNPVPEAKADEINGDLFLLEEAESIRRTLRSGKMRKEHTRVSRVALRVCDYITVVIVLHFWFAASV